MSRALRCTSSVLLPDLVLQKAHVAVEQGVGGRQDPNRLHPRPPLHRALHCHVGKAGEAKVAALTEVAVERGERDTDEAVSHEKQRCCQMAVPFFFFFFFARQHFPRLCPARMRTWGCILILKISELATRLCKSVRDTDTDPHMKSVLTRWEPLAMALNSTPSRSMSLGRHHSSMFPITPNKQHRDNNNDKTWLNRYRLIQGQCVFRSPTIFSGIHYLLVDAAEQIWADRSWETEGDSASVPFNLIMRSVRKSFCWNTSWSVLKMKLQVSVIHEEKMLYWHYDSW